MKRLEVDGIPWSEFKEQCDTDPNLPGYWGYGFGKGLEEEQGIVNFRHQGYRITLFQDGSWFADAAPDWDGSS